MAALAQSTPRSCYVSLVYASWVSQRITMAWWLGVVRNATPKACCRSNLSLLAATCYAAKLSGYSASAVIVLFVYAVCLSVCLSVCVHTVWCCNVMYGMHVRHVRRLDTMSRLRSDRQWHNGKPVMTRMSGRSGAQRKGANDMRFVHVCVHKELHTCLMGHTNLKADQHESSLMFRWQPVSTEG